MTDEELRETRRWAEESEDYRCRTDVLPLLDEVERLRLCLADLLKSGEHDGPCTNVDYDSCDLHVEAAAARKRRGLEALGRLTEFSGNLQKQQAR